MIAAAASVRYRFAHFELQPDERRLLARGEAVRLRPHAFDLLLALVAQRGHLVTKEKLLAQVWGKVVVEENALQAQISALRKVLGAEAIATVSGQGYRFTLDVTPVEAAATASHETKGNLPQQLTSFIGREREIAQVRQLLVSTRLLTLTGAGGCGKTRLALQVAADAPDRYPDGVWLAELAPLSNPTLVAQAVAKALGVKEQAGKDFVETVAEWLATRRLLVVLDNAEHMIPACAQFADLLLRRCAGLALLVTSRERLGIAGELTYRVPSLSVPGAGQDATSEQGMACEAARLFVDRARLQRPDFEVTPEDARSLGSICRRLDGIALAIELAAARVRVMSLEELSRRLNDRFAVLTGGSRAALPRHRTLRSLIDWSYELLGDAEKAVLRRASVFAGGWTLEAAEQVCSGDGVDRSDMLDLLTALTDKNLVAAESQGDATRFTQLETVRHYAQDRLRESGELESVRDRHAGYVLEMADQLRDTLGDAELKATLRRFDREDDNVRAALARCEETPAGSVRGLRLAGQLYWFWMLRGYYGEGRGWISRLLAVDGSGARGEVHARAFRAAGLLTYLQSDPAAAEVQFREALAIWRKLGDHSEIANSLGFVGDAVLARNDVATARVLLVEALAIAREADDRLATCRALQRLGRIAFHAADLAAARAFLEESASIAGDLGRSVLRNRTLCPLGRVLHLQGDFPAAKAVLTEALQGFRSLQDRDGLATTLAFLGSLSHEAGDSPTAKSQLAEALAILHALGQRATTAHAMEEFAAVLLALAGPLAAARLFGAADRLRQGYPRNPAEEGRYERQVAAARSALRDDAAFDRAWDDGQSWTQDEAVRYALSL